MSKHKYISLEGFSEQYDVSPEAVAVLKFKGKTPESTFVKLNGKVYIDAKYYTRRRDFRLKVQMACQDLYYYLSEFFSNQEIATTIGEMYNSSSAAIYSSINGNIFSIVEPGFNSTKIPGGMWFMYKYYRVLNRKLRTRGTSISALLDKRIYK